MLACTVIWTMAGMFCPLTGQTAPAPAATPATPVTPVTPVTPATPVTGGHAAPQDDAALRKERAELEATRAELRALLQADPCAIPAEVGGVPLDPLIRIPEKAGQTTAPAGPASSTGPASGTAGTPPATPPTAGTAAGPTAGTADDFRTSSEAIDAATPLILTNNAMGTGFFVAPGIVATNRHVVEKSPGLIVLISKSLGGLARGRLLAVGRGDRDYALIKVESASFMPDPLPLCGGVRKTDKIASWGYPGVISESDPKFKALLNGDLSAVPEGIYSEGVVNVVYETAPSMVLHTATLSPGNSGGPLVNAEGCVVGINTMIHMDDQSYRQTNIALAISDLVAFMQQNGITPRFKPGR